MKDKGEQEITLTPRVLDGYHRRNERTNMY